MQSPRRYCSADWWYRSADMCGNIPARRNRPCSNQSAAHSARKMKSRERAARSSRKEVESPISAAASSYCSLTSALAFRAIETRALAHDHVPDRRRACVARFSLAAVHAEPRGESARLSARIPVAAKRRPVAADRGAQNHRHTGRDFFELAPRNASGPPRRTHSGAKQNFGRVNIADAGDDSLIHDQVLDRRGPSARLRRKIVRVEFARQRLRAETLQLRRGSQRGALDQTNHAEAPRIVVYQPRPVIQRKFKMVVVGIELAGIEAIVPMSQAAGHAEVDEQHMVAVELDDQIFCAARQFHDSPARDGSAEIRGDAAAQPLLADSHLHDRSADRGAN